MQTVELFEEEISEMSIVFCEVTKINRKKENLHQTIYTLRNQYYQVITKANIQYPLVFAVVSLSFEIKLQTSANRQV